MAGSAFTRPPIDGNAVIRDIQNRKNSIAPGEGRISDGRTGQILVSSFGNEPGVAQQVQPEPSPYERGQMQDEAYDQMDQDMIYDQEEYDGGRDMVTQEAMTYDGSAGEGAEDPSYDRSGDDDYEEQRMKIMTQMGAVSNFMEKSGLSMDDVFNNLNPNTPKEDIDMLFNGKNMKSDEDAYGASMALEDILDAIGADHERFFDTGEVVECGPECQERRALKAAEMNKPPVNNDGTMMEMGDSEFNQKFAMLGE